MEKHAKISAHTIVVGSGAAAFNTADTLYSLGSTDVIIVTENVNWGTSRNTGSDKQTYYKLTLSGSTSDSVSSMALDLFSGKCVDGFHALCEAAGSAEGFFKLVQLGVPFPKNDYGEYVGYKTDHDPHERATSAGPYTSRAMTDALEKSVRSKNIPIYSGYQLIKITADDSRAYGFIALNLENCAAGAEPYFTVFTCDNLVLATGGPSYMYRDSVYPASQHGATGEAFEAGAKGKNLTEWQLGLASVQPRWNVSGTYMQVLPRFISTDADGSDEREFLFSYPVEPSEMLSYVFLKGYQWPFDIRKLENGSSLIDALVYCEKKKGRRVFLDFRTNPLGTNIGFPSLKPEAYEYLQKNGACFGTPIERLKHMNMPAVNFYRDHNIDLERERLEIALCVQHNNGGISVDENYQTSVKGLFAVGEAAATHGVYRPGGSALNAGQTGSRRAAEYIAFSAPNNSSGASSSSDTTADSPYVQTVFENALEWCRTAAQSALSAQSRTYGQSSSDAAQSRTYGQSALSLTDEITSVMSRDAGAVRSAKSLRCAFDRCTELRTVFGKSVAVSSPAQLPVFFRLNGIIACQRMYLAAMIQYIEHNKGSRGSALYTDYRGRKPYLFLPDECTYMLEKDDSPDILQEMMLDEHGEPRSQWREPYPLPAEQDTFENVWRSFRAKRNISRSMTE